MKRPVVITLLVLALVLVLAGIGATLYFSARNFATSFKIENQPFATLNESKTLKVDTESPVTLKIVDNAGNITVVGADVDSVQVKAVKISHAPTQARAEDEVQKIKYDVKQTGNAITITYKSPHLTTDLPDINFFNPHWETVDFVITVPNQTSVDVQGDLGEINISDIKGNTDITNSFGDVTVQSMQGRLSVSNNNGLVNATSITAGSEDIKLNSDFGAVILKSANGNNITLESNSGKITLKEVHATGSITTHTDFGDTTFENGYTDSLNIVTNSGSVSLIKINVSKEIKVQNDFGGIDLQQAQAASYDLHTNSGTISVDGAKGKLKAYTDFGSIKIENAESVTLDVKTNSGTVDFNGTLSDGAHTVKSDFGDIEMTLPSDSALSVDLKTDFGKIKSDLPITVTVNGNSDSDSTGDHIVGSINGGGAQLTVETNSGSVTLRTSK